MPPHVLTSRRLPSVLLAAALFTFGCDPSTTSHIVNRTTGPMEVEVAMDTAECGAGSYTRDLLRSYGETADALDIDTTRFTGRYRLGAGRSMIVHQDLGTAPKWCFDELRLTKDGYTAVFLDAAAIGDQFKRGEDNRYEFIVTDAFFAEAAATFDLQTEHVGWLRLGLSEDEVLNIMGMPAARGEIEDIAAFEEFGQLWFYPDLGIVLDMRFVTVDAPKTLGALTVQPPSTLTTQRGIGIGSSRAEVLQAYGAVRASEIESWPQGADIFIAGSIYGGVIFTFTEGSVTEIFLGAAAE